jgi:thiosulfate/3-mercaptopyruvate sulfurtransferase
MTANGALVTTDWVAAEANGPAYRVVEVDEDTEAYRQGHIPGAIAWHWRDDLHGHPRRDFVDREGLAALLARSGVGPDTTVVLYGGNNNWFATYAYWLMRYRGFDRVRLMDGGRIKWELEGRELTRAEPAVTAADPGPLGPERPELRAFRDDALGHMSGEGAAMIDVRSPAEFAGEVLAPPHLPQEQAQVPGHIPGAANVPWATAAREDGSFRSPDELARIYAEAGATPERDVIAYCRIGERSSHTWFVLHEILGYPRVRNYDGSWTEYGSLVGVPVETAA